MTDAATDTSWFNQLPPGKSPLAPPPNVAAGSSSGPSDTSWFSNLPAGKVTAAPGTYTPPTAPMPTPIGVDDYGSPIYDTSTPEGAAAAADQRDPISRMTEKTGEGATFGLLPHLVAGVKTMGSFVPPEMGGTLTSDSDFKQAQQDYQKALNDQRAYTAETSRQYPIASQIAEGVGSLAPTIATFGMVNPLEAGMAKAAPTIMAKTLPKFIGSTVANAGVGGVAGALDAAGHDIGSGNTETIAPDMLGGAGWGTLLGAAAPTVGLGVQKLWDGTKWVYNLAGSKGFIPKTGYQTSDALAGQQTGNASYMAPDGVVRATPQQLDSAVAKIEDAATPAPGQNPQLKTADDVLHGSIDPITAQNPNQNTVGPRDTTVPKYERTLAQQVAGAQIPEYSAGLSHLQEAYSDSDTYGPRFAALQQNQDTTLARTVQYPNSRIALSDPYAPGREFTNQLDALHQSQLAEQAAKGAVVTQGVDALGTPVSATESGTTMKTAVDAQQAPKQAAADQAVADAQAARDQALAATPAGKQPIPGGATVAEQYGAEGRAQALTGQKASSDNVSRLYDIVGNPSASAATLKSEVASVYDGMAPTAAQPKGEEAAILKTVSQLPDNVPLSDLTALRERINDEISREVTSAGTTTTGPAKRLLATKSAIDNAINEPLATRAAAEQQAVQAGHMAPQDTMQARLQAERDAWQAQRGQGASTATNAPMTPEDAAALQEARAAAQKHAQTYGTGAVDDILQTGEHASAAKGLVPDEVTRAKGGFKTPDADVMAKVWNGKETEAANLRAAQDAGITPDLLKAHAADDLRAAAVDENGNFDPKAYSKWRRDHAAGLHVFPEVKDAFDGMEKAQATLAAARENAAATAASHPLAGITDPAHVPDTYMVRGDDGATQVKKFIADTGGDQAAMQAYDDSFIRKMYDVPGLIDRNTGLINARKLEKLTSDYSGMLSQRNELAGKLSNLKNAQDLYDQVKGDAAIQMRNEKNGITKNFLGGLDPVVAVQKVFDGPNSEANFKALVGKLQGNPDALEGMRNAVSRYLVNKARSAGLQSTGGMDPLKAADLGDWIRRNKPTLLEIYGTVDAQGHRVAGQALNNIQAAMKEMRLKSEVTNTAGAIPTAAKSMFKDEEAPNNHGVSMGGMLLGGVIGRMFHGWVPGGEEGAMAIGGTVENLIRSFKQAGLKSQDDLVATMLASPETTREWRAIVQAKRAVTPLQIGRFIQALTRATPNMTGLTVPARP